MTAPSAIRPVLLLGLALALSSAATLAQPLAPGMESGTAEDEARSALETLEEQARALEQRSEEWAAQAREFEQAQQNAPERQAELEAEIAALRDGPLPDADAGALAERSIDQLEVLVLGAEQDLTLAQQEAAALEAELDRRSERRRQLPALLADAKSRLQQLEPLPPAAGEDAALLAARERVAALREEALRHEVRSLEQEMLSYDVRGELLDERVERARLRETHAEARLEALRQTLTGRREGEAEREAERALASLDAASALKPAFQKTVRQLAQSNAELAQSRTGEQGVLQAIEDVSRKLTRADQRVTQVEADLERLAFKIDSAGLSDSVGLLLRRTRSELPDVGKYRRFIRMRQERIAEVEARQDELREELASLADIDAIVEDGLADASDRDRTRLAALLRDLLETKRRHLEALLDDYEIYFQKLVDFDARQQQLITETERLLRFIDERVLWIPSASAIRPLILRDTLEALRWFATPRWWGQVARASVAALRDAPFLHLWIAALLVLALVLVRRAPARLGALAEAARAPNCISGRPTGEALGWTLLLAAWAPALLAAFAWRLGLSPDATLFVRSFAAALFGVALVWFSLELPRQLLRSDLCGAHFGWPGGAARALRRRIAWLAAVALPLIFAIQLFETRGDEAARESLGRIAFVAAMAAVAWFSQRVLREGGPLRELLHDAEPLRLEPWAWRLLHLAAVAVPLGFGVAAARGYYWTALQLGTRFHATLVFAFLLFVLFHGALRWMGLARRRLALAQLEEARAQAEPGEPAPAETPVDLATVDAQTTRLLKNSTGIALLLGFWLLWAELVPALGVLDGVELWQTRETVNVEVPAADGSTQLQSEERVVAVTLGDALLALVLAFGALVLVRNLPGLLEVSLFRRLGLGAGERYAYATIAKYALTLIGGTLALSVLGVGWSNIQWLVAAVGIGLGFGLQEIFANFVSGLIILFERPIRVGDTVTVGEISGTVSRIRIRATWITGFDRKELVVPNKEFVTNRLVNWSLTDPVLRVDVPVGVAYGSDVELALRTLLELAKANPDVLDKPEPQVIFRAFGASSLDLELRVFSPDIEHRLEIQHELHLAIDRAFREAEIEIAFPQRDLHLRSVPEGWSPQGD